MRHNILATGLPVCNDSTNTWDYKQPEELNISNDIASKQNRERSLLVKQFFDKIGFLSKEQPKTSEMAVETLIYSLLKDRPSAEPIKFKVTQFELNEEILAFSSKHGILAYIPEVLTLLENNFTLIESINVKIVEDPEVGEEWLSFEVSVHGEVDEVLKSYDSYVTQFVSKIPWPESDKIRLSYFII